MSVNLQALFNEYLEILDFDGQLIAEPIELSGRLIKFLEPIQYKCSINKVDEDHLLHCNVSLKYEELCGKCLNSFIKTDDLVLSGRLVDENKDENEYEDYLDSVYYNKNILNIEKHILSSIILSLPMKPLCDINCKGLCIKCGTNLNEKKCQCIVEDIDPRFEILKDFFE